MVAKRFAAPCGDPGDERAVPKENRAARVVWRQSAGRPMACRKKLKVLNENFEKIRPFCQDALEDVVLMGCDEALVRDAFEAIIRSIRIPYAGDD